MQQTYILLISLLTGLVAAGFMWFLWDLAEKVYELMERRRQQRRLKQDADELLAQAKPAGAAERPR
jgi:hypothetical protein